MSVLKTFRLILLAGVTGFALTACSDSSTEIASPGNEGPNPGTGGGDGGNNGGGNTGTGDPADCTGDSVAVTDDDGNTICQLTGEMTQDLTIPSTTPFAISGKVTVGTDGGATAASGTGGFREGAQVSGVTLTIQPGAVIVGETATDVLVVPRGNRIVAEGTADNPIIFTSLADVEERFFDNPSNALSEPYTSEWGGLVINGRAPINTCNGDGICEAEGEGDSGLYGGDDPNDDSGILKYVQIRYAGNPITSTDELNGIAFQGVGAGTEVDYVHVHNGADDGVEFFGGTVNVKHLVITGADDDSIDWTQGWTGKLQHAVVILNPNQAASDRGIEADNLEGNEDYLPRSAPTLSNITFIGNDDVGDTAIVLRRGTAAKIMNVVATGWRDACFDIDSNSTFTVAGTSATNLTGDLTLTSTLFGCSDAIEGTEDTDPWDTEDFYTAQANNVAGPTSLSSTFINGANENAVTATDPSAIDSFFDSVDYIGAVKSPSAADNWTLGWTYGLNADPECPTGTTENSDGACVLEGTYTSDMTLSAGRDYILSGKVVFGVDVGPEGTASTGDAANLTVDAGVTVTGEDNLSYLVITRGSKLFSNGTLDRPVTFTGLPTGGAATPDMDVDTSLWGGIVINGRASLNTCNGSGICEAEGEGDSGLYGGNLDTDSSGVIKYTRVLYAGNPITSTDELNGIAFQGVGSGTDIDYLQVHNGADDGIEMFGGTVNLKHVVITGADDDSIDWTQGWRGKIQHALVILNNNQAASDRGIEADNLEGNEDYLPRSAPMLSNLTFIGAADVGDTAIVLRRGTAARIWNVVGTNWRDACYDLDSDSTFAVAGTSATNLTGDLTLESTLFGCSDAIEGTEDTDPWDTEDFYTAQANNVAGPTSLAAPAGGGKAYINGANEAAVTATDVSAIDSFFDSVDYIGAVENEANDWTAGWTIWLDQQ